MHPHIMHLEPPCPPASPTYGSLGRGGKDVCELCYASQEFCCGSNRPIRLLPGMSASPPTAALTASSVLARRVPCMDLTAVNRRTQSRCTRLEQDLAKIVPTYFGQSSSP
jgi:hypothetical protein